MNIKRIKGVFIVGEIASGKSTYMKSIKTDDDLVIELGEIVREITHQEERVFDNGLDDAIYSYCRDLIGESIDQISRVIFVGPRSPKLMEKLVGLVNDYIIYFLQVPYLLRRERFEKSARVKDEGLSFEDAVSKDKSIGMDVLVNDLLSGSKYSNVVIIHSDYDEQ